MSIEGNQRCKRVRIESLDQLRVIANRFDPVDIGILYNPIEIAGQQVTPRSSKLIQYRRNRNGRHWWIHSMSDSSERYYTEPQLRRQTNIVEAIEKGALYREIDLNATQGSEE